MASTLLSRSVSQLKNKIGGASSRATSRTPEGGAAGVRANATIHEAVSSGTRGKAATQDLTFHDKYYVGSKLGKGSFGQVYVARRTDRVNSVVNFEFVADEADRAVKIVDLRCVKGDLHRKALESELHVWAKLTNRAHCVHLYEVFRSQGLTYMVMEKCDSTLLSHLDSLGDGLNERSLAAVFVQMLLGMKELHSLKIVHRDIKPDNFFVGGRNGDTVKLGDFGLARTTTESVDFKIDGECGTSPYMCPEMLARQRYNEKADVWSFGVVVYVLLFGRYPYTPEQRTAQEMRKAILNENKKIDYGSAIPLSACTLAFVMRLLNRDPTERPTTVEALKMSFMKKTGPASAEDLRSLRPALRLAVKVQAFENRALVKDGLDDMLNCLQIEKLGTPLSETSPCSSSSMASFDSHMRHTNSDRSNKSNRSRCTSNSTSTPSSKKSTPSSIETMAMGSSRVSSWKLTSEMGNGSFTNEGSWTCNV